MSRITPKVCKWREDDDAHWKTACRGYDVASVDRVYGANTRWTHCPYCGQELRVVKRDWSVRSFEL